MWIGKLPFQIQDVMILVYPESTFIIKLKDSLIEYLFLIIHNYSLPAYAYGSAREYVGYCRNHLSV